MTNVSKIILFDGVCNLCNGAIQFILKRDQQDVFKFAPLSSTIGKKLLAERNIDPQTIDSIILIEPNIAYYAKSDAILEISKSLSGYKTLATIAEFLPKGLRDAIYDFTARNRYSWFGKKTQCMIPTPETKSKFLL